MTGLRDRKKKEIRHRIINAAAGLIAEAGLDDTTMEEIAVAADVSVATVYNYFGTKSALLLAGVAEETATMIKGGEAILASPGSDPEAAVKRLLHAYLKEIAEWDPRLLREVMGASFQTVGGVELTSDLAQLDRLLIDQMMTLLAHFHQEDKLADGVEVYDATLLVFSAFFLQLFMYMSLDDFEISDLNEQVDRQIALVFAGIEKAN